MKYFNEWMGKTLLPMMTKYIVSYSLYRVYRILCEMLAAIRRVMLLSYEGKKSIHDFVVLYVLNCVLWCYYVSLWL